MFLLQSDYYQPSVKNNQTFSSYTMNKNIDKFFFALLEITSVSQRFGATAAAPST